MIPIVIYARKESERCKNKLLRPFINDESLLDICLRKFTGRDDVYLASRSDEMLSMANKYEIKFIERSITSILSEESYIIHKYLFDIDSDNICLLNPCCLFMSAQTVDDAINYFNNHDISSLFSVYETHELIFDSEKHNINKDIIFNSKLRKPNYIGNNAIVIFNKNVLFSTQKYWTYDDNDPYLYITDRIEAIDVDTEFDFVLAQSLYEKLYDK